MVSRTEGNIDDSLIGGNASAEGTNSEGTESTVVTGVNIVMNHHLQETSFTKEAYKKYIKDYMKSIKGKLEEQKPEIVKSFMTGAAEQIKHILANFKNYQFFTGENMNPDGMVALLDYREDVVTAYMIFFKDGLEMEKFHFLFPPTFNIKAFSPVRSVRKNSLLDHNLGISQCKTPVDDPINLLYNMNDCYSKLKELVPSIPQNKKVSKMENLQHVIDYILDLQIALDLHPTIVSLHHQRPRQNPSSRTPLTTINTDISILSLQAFEFLSELMSNDIKAFCG
ncbi:PREDICTED: uncharacterized protein LOC102823990 [Chrysochloris asiatica]|uniref:DNA-binding protein inhibitor ID-2 n=1 Tax=Chrysochloris asiatica TaxID=185453 RepID=A0A9B0TVU4_CHRAS|nr:PREDICTED: uncharacterized protein LOC102823990 [Chrysochloris asiatica]